MNIEIQQPAQPSSFVKAGGSTPRPTASWLEENRNLIVRASLLLAVVVLVALAVGTYITNESAKADSAFSSAMDIYDAPIRQPGQPVDPSTSSYATAAERAQAAHPLFAQTANKYGLFKAGKNSLYFAGLTAVDMGQAAEAEADLKKASETHDSGLASLAKLALASLYRQTSRQPQAIEIYQKLIAKPTLAVPQSTARLELAETYEATQPEQARKLYAQIKDQDKTSAASQIASQKLEGKK